MHRHKDLRYLYPEVERPLRLDGKPGSIEKCLEPLIKNFDRILELIEEVIQWKGLEHENTFVFQSRAMGTCKPTSDIDIYIQLDEKHRKLILECGAEYGDTGVMLIVGETRNRFLEDIPQKILEELEILRVDLYFGVERIPPAKGRFGETKYYINFKDLRYEVK